MKNMEAVNAVAQVLSAMWDVPMSVGWYAPSGGIGYYEVSIGPVSSLRVEAIDRNKGTVKLAINP